jgi:hypothetical protein
MAQALNPVLDIEINPEMTLSELQIELFIACGRMLGRSQFYEWLKAAWIVKPAKRGGIKLKQTFTQRHLNRLIKLSELMTQYSSLKVCQPHLFEAMKQAPEHYFDLEQE